jgi:hypothetical protein
MARYNGPVCRLCRREGMKLYLKGDRCYSESVQWRNAIILLGRRYKGVER